MAASAVPVIGVLGAGAMGAGIAQLAAVHGHDVVLADVQAGACTLARDRIGKALARDVEKGRRTAQDAEAALQRLTLQHVETEAKFSAFAGCDLVIEAIVEQLEAKRTAFRRMEQAVRPDCVLASNTSSLSIASVAAACERPERVLGIHFFNPAPVMPLVEIIPGVRSDRSIVQAARAIVDRWGKSTVLALDTPGFIVNRVARPFYGEALRLLDEGLATAVDIDWAMTTLGGFRMGPFELMDFIGHDVNYVVTESVWSALYYDPRFKPSLSQRRLVEAGWLGRKTGRGFYDYSEGAQRPAPLEDRAAGERILRRILVMLINEACDAVYHGIASADDVETAMLKGVNYPRGLLEWGDELGAAAVLRDIDALHDEYREDRYRASPLLRRAARDGRSLRA